jgi:hypothetical protein
MTPNEELLEECLAHLNALPNIRANLANHRASSFSDGAECTAAHPTEATSDWVGGQIIVKSPFHSTDYHYNIKLTLTNANVGVVINQSAVRF